MTPFRDCVSRNPQENELLVITSYRLFDLACAARDRVTQAVLLINESTSPLTHPELDELLDDEQFKLLTFSLGVGADLSSFGQSLSDCLFDPTNLRYGKITLLFEDGPTATRIRTQLLTWLFLYFRPVLENVYVHVERPSDEIPPVEFEERYMRRRYLNLRRVSVGDTLSETLSLN